MIYSLFLFNRSGDCLYYEQWNKQRVVKNPREDQKLIFGILHSLLQFCDKLSPKGSTEFHSFKTKGYKLHYFDVPTGLKFVMITDPNVLDQREALKTIYSSIYVEYAAKNPLQAKQQTITCQLFAVNLNKFIRSLSYFST